jgi:hypothetical protein
MATATIVITYTAATAFDQDEVISGCTVGGTAYGSLTAADIQAAIRLMKKMAAKLEFDKASTIRTSGITRQTV